METIHNPKRLEKYLEQYNIPEKFRTKGLHFRLLSFHKGEYLVSPSDYWQDLLFLVDGSVQVFSLTEDAGLSAVANLSPPAILGDMEFATGTSSGLHVEAKSEVYCVALSFLQYGCVLREDCVFLNELLESIANKFRLSTYMDVSNHPLKERLLFYMENICKGQQITSIQDTVSQMHCSRRQLQRVLKELCNEEKIEKQKKGIYVLKP